MEAVICFGVGVMVGSIIVLSASIKNKSERVSYAPNKIKKVIEKVKNDESKKPQGLAEVTDEWLYGFDKKEDK